MRKKIAIIGAGNVGTTTAQLIAERDLADVVLIDIVEGIPQGKALDIQEACPLWNSGAKVWGTNDFREMKGSDIVVVTAGLARKPGMSRDDLLQANAEIIKDIAVKIREINPGCIIIVVTNPMDAMTQITQKISGFPPKRVIGMGGVLDSARMRTFIALETGCHPEDVRALVLGGHGDLMVPLPRFTEVKGRPITEVLNKEKIKEIVERTRNGGAEIVGLLKTGSAYYAPAASVVEMIENIFEIKDEIIPCSVFLRGEYGINGIYTGVPVRLHVQGVKEIVELELTEEEKNALLESSLAVKRLVEKISL